MSLKSINGDLLKVALEGAANYLILNKEEVNSLNVFPVPDGDTGTNMSLTIKSAVKQALEIEENDASKVAIASSRGSLMGARGNSGVILSQLFRGFSDGIEGKKEIDVKSIAIALKRASETTYNAVMKPTEGTILTVARETADYALRVYKKHMDVIEFLEDIIGEAEKSLERTPLLLPVLKQANVVDAGGKGFVLILIGAYKALKGEKIEIAEDETLKKKAPADVNLNQIDEDIEFGYCTEFIINTENENEDVNSFRDKLLPLGDSILVVGGSGIIKTHLHTNNPGKALEYALELGALQDIKIDNMRYQHKEILFEKELKELKEKEELQEEAKEYSFISVSVGDGLNDVFKSLNVDYIVPGGQTMNPSTEDFLLGVEKVKGKNIFIIPNNSNIILAAEQAKKLSDKNIQVIPSKTIPQGISALLAFDENSDFEENANRMNKALENVKSAQITFSVRDTEMNGKKIKEGDIIGIAEKEILSSGSEVEKVAVDLIDNLMDDEISIVTLYLGKDTDQEDAENLIEKLEEKYDDVDFEIVPGGQPLYYYIISLE